jgi:outer membrane lipoprotein-sorting protein
MRITPVLCLFVCLFISLQTLVPIAMCQETSPTPQKILEHMDEVVNAPKDQMQNMELQLINKNGSERERSLKMWQKGDDMRTVKFLAPADVRNIGFLSLPDDVMYLYLPAFKKVRRIAAHVKNQKFAGTDFTYDDMGSMKYAEDYDARLVEESEEIYLLELTPKESVKKDYSRLKMWIQKDSFYPTRTEYYDHGNNLRKVMERREVSQIEGYWTASEIDMHDLKIEHRTIMRLSKITFDAGLSDDIFTERFLQRRP